mmetsp:Transcript_7077/g.29289  ORF Transcript_7077/g.29289 Transcript_7077/m.29289 type:complete len:231 (-) Transcript_7077:910-1602(-)
MARIRSPHTMCDSVSRSSGTVCAIGICRLRRAACQNGLLGSPSAYRVSFQCPFRVITILASPNVVAPTGGRAHHLAAARFVASSTWPKFSTYPYPIPPPAPHPPLDDGDASYTHPSILFALLFHPALPRGLKCRSAHSLRSSPVVPGSTRSNRTLPTVSLYDPPRPKKRMCRSGTDAEYTSPVASNSIMSVPLSAIWTDVPWNTGLGARLPVIRTPAPSCSSSQHVIGGW